MNPNTRARCETQRGLQKRDLLPVVSQAPQVVYAVAPHPSAAKPSATPIVYFGGGGARPLRDCHLRRGKEVKLGLFSAVGMHLWLRLQRQRFLPGRFMI